MDICCDIFSSLTFMCSHSLHESFFNKQDIEKKKCDGNKKVFFLKHKTLTWQGMVTMMIYLFLRCMLKKYKDTKNSFWNKRVSSLEKFFNMCFASNKNKQTWNIIVVWLWKNDWNKRTYFCNTHLIDTWGFSSEMLTWSKLVPTSLSLFEFSYLVSQIN